MNYITEIKAFYDFVQVKQLSQGQIALWHALMHINNKCAWIEWFSVPNITLELHTGLSRQAIVKARNVLKMYGLIDFKTNGTKATNYKMISMSKSLQVGCQDSLQDGLQVGCQDSLQVGCTLNKLNKTKLNKTIEEAEQEKQPTPTAVDFYLQNINPVASRFEVEEIQDYEKELPSDLIIHAMKISIEQRKTSLKYIKGILRSWKSKGILCLKQAIEEQQEKEKAPSEDNVFARFMERHKGDELNATG